jgi:antitoxin VapB
MSGEGERERLTGEQAAKLDEALEAIVRRVDALPVLDDRSADEIIGYDENGLPS